MGRNLQVNNNYSQSPPPQTAANHNMNDLSPPMVLEPYKSINPTNTFQNSPNYASLAIESTTDLEQQMVGLLPDNLKRIHEVIDRLTNKLMIKNGQLHELRLKYDKLSRKYKQLEYNVNLYSQSHANSQSSSARHTTHTTMISSSLIIDHDEDDFKMEQPPPPTRANTANPTHNYTGHVVTNSSFDSYLPNILDKLNLKAPQFGDSLEEDQVAHQES